MKNLDPFSFHPRHWNKCTKTCDFCLVVQYVNTVRANRSRRPTPPLPPPPEKSYGVFGYKEAEELYAD